MSSIEWTSSLSVHNEELDAQHRELIQIYNNLHNSLMNDTLEGTVKTKMATLDALVNYISFHFNAEEKFLESIGFPEFAQHRRKHLEFGQRIKTYQADIVEGRMVLSTSLMKLMRNWIIDHIATEDKKYADFYRQQK